MISQWVDSAIAARSGPAIVRLLQAVAGAMQRLLIRRHNVRFRTDREGAAAIESLLTQISAARAAFAAQPGLVQQTTRAGLLPYMPGFHPTDTDENSAPVRLIALQRRISELVDAASMPDAPVGTLADEAAALVVEAVSSGVASVIASACHERAALSLRRNDLAGCIAACLQGETALLPDGSRHEALFGGELETFLLLRALRLLAEVDRGDHEAVLDCAEDTIRLIESRRFRISDPFQQAAFLNQRTLFYEFGAFAAWKTRRWDTMLSIMDLFKSRSALRNRLAPPPDEEADAVAARLDEATEALAHAPPEDRPALAVYRQQLWSLLTVVRLRGAADRVLPTLTLASVQAALAPDEAMIAWIWISPVVLLVLAIDAARITVEQVKLDKTTRGLLDTYIGAAQAGRMHNRALGSTVATLADAVLPEATRAFVSGAKRLILSPHRELHLLPFHAAIWDGKFLIERMAVRTVPNFGSLLLPWEGASGGVLSLGIDRFAAESTRPLQAAEAEAEDVARVWAAHGETVTTLLGAQATMAGLRAQALDRFRWLHLATHGTSVFAASARDDPFASGLLLRDGMIDALTLGQTRLRAELVVLSACHSGERALAMRGLDVLPGDDMFGLQAAFFQAGACGVLGTLWQANDRSARLIVPVVHERLAAGDPPEIALQAALRSYLARADAERDIYFWAPFFLSGMGRRQRTLPLEPPAGAVRPLEPNT